MPSLLADNPPVTRGRRPSAAPQRSVAKRKLHCAILSPLPPHIPHATSQRGGGGGQAFSVSFCLLLQLHTASGTCLPHYLSPRGHCASLVCRLKVRMIQLYMPYLFTPISIQLDSLYATFCFCTHTFTHSTHLRWQTSFVSLLRRTVPTGRFVEYFLPAGTTKSSAFLHLTTTSTGGSTATLHASPFPTHRTCTTFPTRARSRTARLLQRSTICRHRAPHARTLPTPHPHTHTHARTRTPHTPSPHPTPVKGILPILSSQSKRREVWEDRTDSCADSPCPLPHPPPQRLHCPGSCDRRGGRRHLLAAATANMAAGTRQQLAGWHVARQARLRGVCLPACCACCARMASGGLLRACSTICCAAATACTHTPHPIPHPTTSPSFAAAFAIYLTSTYSPALCVDDSDAV